MSTESGLLPRRVPAHRRRHWDLHVYVADHTPRSVVTIANLKRLCDQNLPGQYRIEVVDLLKNPERSKKDAIIAIPTVVRRFPLPERRAIGTLSDAETARLALELN